jgi:polygalacturonase
VQFQAFVYAHTATDLTISGSGTIDGSGEWWWANLKNRTAVPSGRPNLIQMVDVKGIEVTGVTLLNSPFWCLHPVQSQDIHVHHMKIRSRMCTCPRPLSPPLLLQFLIKLVHVLDAPNSDGVDPDSSRNVMIEHNDISTGDDGSCQRCPNL